MKLGEEKEWICLIFLIFMVKDKLFSKILLIFEFSNGYYKNLNTNPCIRRFYCKTYLIFRLNSPIIEIFCLCASCFEVVS